MGVWFRTWEEGQQGRGYRNICKRVLSVVLGLQEAFRIGK